MSNTVEISWYNVALTGCSSCLSIFGGFIIILTYLKLKCIRNYTRTLLVFLTIADLLTAAGNLVAVVRYAVIHSNKEFNQIWKTNCTRSDLSRDFFTSLRPAYESSTAILNHTFSNDLKYSGKEIQPSTLKYMQVGTYDLAEFELQDEPQYNMVCRVQSFITTYSNLSSFLWTTIIAFHIWFSVMTKSRKSEMTCLKVIFHLISWIVPVCIVGSFYEYLGEDECYGTGVWCGVKSGLSRDVVRRIMFIVDVGWQLSCYLLTTFFCVTIKLRIWSKRRYGTAEELREISNYLRHDDRNFIKIVLIIYSLKIWGIIRFFITAFVSEDTLVNNNPLFGALTFLLAMQSYGASGQAFWNFVLFCISDKVVRSKMAECLWCRGSGVAKQLYESKQPECDPLKDPKLTGP